MREDKIPRRLSLASSWRMLIVVLAMLGALAPSLQGGAPAAAAGCSAVAGSLSVSPNPVTAGLNVNLCGNGFQANVAGTLVTVTMALVSTPSTLINSQQYTTQTDGTLGPVNYPIPLATAAGNYYVYATGTGPSSTSITLTGTLTVGSSAGTPLTIVVPSGGIPANTPTYIGVSGGGFTGNEAVTLWVATVASPNNPIPGTTITPANASGGFFSFQAYQVNLPAGNYILYAKGNTSLVIDTGQFSVNNGSPNPGPNILTLSTSTANLTVGQALVVSGCFFTTPPVYLYLSTTPSTAGIISAPQIAPLVGGCIGGIGSANNFVVPSVVTGGTYYIVAVDGAGHVAYVQVTVNGTVATGTLTFNLIQYVPGQPVIATGCASFFTSPGPEPVTIAITGLLNVLYSSITSSSAGCITVTFLAPAVGNYTVTMTGNSSGHVATGTLVVSNGTCNPYNTYCCPNNSCNPGGCYNPTNNTTGCCVNGTITACCIPGAVICCANSSTSCCGTPYGNCCSVSVGCCGQYGTSCCNNGAYGGCGCTYTNANACGCYTGYVSNNCGNCGYGNTGACGYCGYGYTGTCGNGCGYNGYNSSYNSYYSNSYACNLCYYGYVTTGCLPVGSNCLYGFNSTGCPCPTSYSYGCVVYPPSQSGALLISSQSTIAPGQPFNLTGAGYGPGTTVTITISGPGMTTITITVTTNSTGTFNQAVPIPYTAPVGTLTISAADTSGKSAAANIQVSSKGAGVATNVGSAAAGQSVSVTAKGFTANEPVTLSLAAPSSSPFAIDGTVQTVTADASGNVTATYTVPSISVGNYLLLALGQTSRTEALVPFYLGKAAPVPTTTGSTGTTQPQGPLGPGTVAFSNLPSVSKNKQLALPLVSSAATTTYFAQGSTGTAIVNGKATFLSRLNLFNSGPTSTTVKTTYYITDPATSARSVKVVTDIVGPGATTARSLNSDIGSDKLVSTLVAASKGVVAEMVVSRIAADGTALDTASSLGSATASRTWYMAEGYIGQSVDEYLTLFNPGSIAANTQVQYFPSKGTSAPAPQAVVVPAHGQVTVDVHKAYSALVPQGSQNISIRVTSDQSVVVDRAIYWGTGAGIGKYGFSIEPAVANGVSSQYFAFLPTDNGSQTFVTVFNPSVTTANVSLNLLNGAGDTVKTVNATVTADQRYTFAVPALLPSKHGKIVGGLITSNSPVIAEAGLYIGGSPNSGQHPGLVVMGSAGGNIGARADISASGAQVYVYNPNKDAIRFRVNVSGASKSQGIFDALIPAHTGVIIPIAAGSNPRGLLAFGSEPFVALLLNGAGGDATVTAYGGNLN